MAGQVASMGSENALLEDDYGQGRKGKKSGKKSKRGPAKKGAKKKAKRRIPPGGGSLIQNAMTGGQPAPGASGAP